MPKTKAKKVYYELSDDSDYDAFIESDESSQTGGVSDVDLSEGEITDYDSPTAATIDSDPDEEYESDENGDGIYDPINEGEEPEDTDDELNENESDESEDGEEEMDSDDEGSADDSYIPESKTCYKKDLNKDFLIEYDDDDTDIYAIQEPTIVPDNERVSDPVMTYYEAVRLLGVRAKLIDLGAEPMISGLEGMHSSQIAYLELITKTMPIKIKRRLPGRRYEIWNIEELELYHVIKDSFYVPGNFDYDELMKNVRKA